MLKGELHERQGTVASCVCDKAKFLLKIHVKIVKYKFLYYKRYQKN